jgi:NAD(P)-dependent dehydrogenase (short-subunit alcohol dehydrogenase family)
MESQPPSPTLRGKTVVLTGATSGIGEIAAEQLAELGARLVLVARDRTRGDALLTQLNAATPGITHTAHYADLCRLAEVRRVGQEIAAAEPHIDVLINNAGAVFSRRNVTEDGLERTFALNHMAYVVLTSLLLDRLVASAPARIINTASNAHRKASSTSTICNRPSRIGRSRSTAHRSSPTSCSPASSRAGSPAKASPSTASRPASWRHASAMRLAASPAHSCGSASAWSQRHRSKAPTRWSGWRHRRTSRRSAASSSTGAGGTLTAEAQNDALARRLWDESERIAADAAARSR